MLWKRIIRYITPSFLDSIDSDSVDTTFCPPVPKTQFFAGTIVANTQFETHKIEKVFLVFNIIFDDKLLN